MLEVNDYLPHTPPMRLIEFISASSETSVTTLTRLTSESAFYCAEAGGIPAWVGLEYLAQTAAVWVGLEDVRNGRPVDPAFLISARQYTVTEPVFVVGQDLFAEVKVEMIEQDIVAFSGQITDAHGRIMANAVFTAYRPENVWSYLGDGLGLAGG
jgi:predicted hotdog family 3-hydroxylacyl-ACP dehydratase